jgi:hypothetical protein
MGENSWSVASKHGWPENIRVASRYLSQGPFQTRQRVPEPVNSLFFMGHDLSDSASKKERVPTKTKVESQSWDTPAFSIHLAGVNTCRLNDS